MKFKPYFILILMFTSCIAIKNKKNLMNINDIGLTKNELKLNGYYYQDKSYKTYPYYKNQYGGYSQDSTKEYNQIRILPIFLDSNGSAEKQGSISGMQDNLGFNYIAKCSLEDNNTIESAFEHFECILNNRPESKLNFINKKAEIWSQGVYKVNGSEIAIQIFYNVMGDYHLYEERGNVLNDTTFILTSAIDYQDGKTFEIEKKYHFKEMNNMPKIESYILKNKNKFEKN